MAAAGAGYAFMPAGSVAHQDVVAKPLIDPEIWREVSLVTVRGGRILRRSALWSAKPCEVRWGNERALAAIRFEQRLRRRRSFADAATRYSSRSP